MNSVSFFPCIYLRLRWDYRLVSLGEQLLRELIQVESFDILREIQYTCYMKLKISLIRIVYLYL